MRNSKPEKLKLGEKRKTWSSVIVMLIHDQSTQTYFCTQLLYSIHIYSPNCNPLLSIIKSSASLDKMVKCRLRSDSGSDRGLRKIIWSMKNWIIWRSITVPLMVPCRVCQKPFPDWCQTGAKLGRFWWASQEYCSSAGENNSSEQ